jgi:hypothetical protein
MELDLAIRRLAEALGDGGAETRRESEKRSAAAAG